MNKMVILGSSNLILSLHHIPEDGTTPNKTLSSFNTTLHMLLDSASQLGIQLHMQDAIKNPLSDEHLLALWLDVWGLDAIKIVLNTAILLDQELPEDLIMQRSSLLLINAPSFDIVGTRYSVNTPLSRVDPYTHVVGRRRENVARVGRVHDAAALGRARAGAGDERAAARPDRVRGHRDVH